MAHSTGDDPAAFRSTGGCSTVELRVHGGWRRYRSPAGLSRVHASFQDSLPGHGRRHPEWSPRSDSNRLAPRYECGARPNEHRGHESTARVERAHGDFADRRLPTWLRRHGARDPSRTDCLSLKRRVLFRNQLRARGSRSRSRTTCLPLQRRTFSRLNFPGSFVGPARVELASARLKRPAPPPLRYRTRAREVGVEPTHDPIQSRAPCRLGYSRLTRRRELNPRPSASEADVIPLHHSEKRWSRSRESNSRLMLPRHMRYHYATSRWSPRAESNRCRHDTNVLLCR